MRYINSHYITLRSRTVSQ